MRKYLALLIAFLFLPAWTDAGFNFRFSSGFVTDSANQTYVTGDTYPTTRAGYTFGWTVALADGTRDRDNAIDVRLAGVNKTANSSSRTFQVDLPSAGTYTIHIALGDAGADHNSSGQYVQVKDSSTVKATISDADGTVTAHYTDATGVDRTNTTWPTNEVGLDVTFATTTANFILGDSGYTGDSTIAHIRIVQAVTITNLISLHDTDEN